MKYSITPITKFLKSAGIKRITGRNKKIWQYGSYRTFYVMEPGDGYSISKTYSQGDPSKAYIEIEGFLNDDEGRHEFAKKIFNLLKDNGFEVSLPDFSTEKFTSFYVKLK